MSENVSVAAVVVTHNRLESLVGSLDILVGQSRAPQWIIVVDNADDPAVRDTVESRNSDAIQTIYLGSKTNLGGAGGFALGMLTALTLGADWVWCADDDGRPEGPEVLATLLECADRHGLEAVSPVVCDIDEPDRLAFPLRRGLEWRRFRSELTDPKAHDKDSLPDDLLPGIASLFNGALLSASTLQRTGVPDYRLFIRGDEVEFHRRLQRTGVPFGTCLTTAYLHPSGTEEFRPILGGRMHTQYPDNEAKRYFTYRNRGYLMNQPGMRKLLPQEYARFGWFFLVQKRDIKGFRNWLSLHKQGRDEKFEPYSG